MPTKIIMVKSYAHKGITSMKRFDENEWEEAYFYGKKINHPELGNCLLGAFITGIGAFNVHFPIDAVRPATEEEIISLMKRKYYSTFAPSFRLEREEFATQQDIDNALEVEEA